MTDATIKSCPFCGGEAYIQAKHMPNWTWNWCNVVCDGCGATVTRAGGEGTFEGAEKAAIAAWNARYHCGLTDEDYNILLDELGVSERTCRSTTDGAAWCFACSECGKSFPRNKLHLAHNHGEINYCPNCGAKVVGE